MNDLISPPNVALVKASNVPALLDKIRPEWKAKSLVERVNRLIEVDPSSACQRIFNAAIHDLKDKIIIAGIDIAAEAAKQHKLPPVLRNEDILEAYSTAKLIDLAYRMGLLSRPEWRRISRCYEIRRDLEHEDDQYEAGVEDCVYIFSTSIEVLLSADPIQLIKVTDVKELVEQAGSVTADTTLIEDYEKAPQPRQIEILKFLISNALDKAQPDLVQQNAYILISSLHTHTQKAVLASIGTYLQEKIGRTLDERHARVAQAAGVFPYLRQSAQLDFFNSIFENMQRVGCDWTAHAHHGELLRGYKEVGGLNYTPEEIRKKILHWLVRTYIGTPGGLTNYGNVRHVFYSNTAAPLIAELISEAESLIAADLKSLSSDPIISQSIKNQHVARRYERLVDMITDE